MGTTTCRLVLTTDDELPGDVRLNPEFGLVAQVGALVDPAGDPCPDICGRGLAACDAHVEAFRSNGDDYRIANSERRVGIGQAAVEDEAQVRSNS